MKDAQKTLEEMIQEASSQGPTLVLLSGGSTVKVSAGVFSNLTEDQWSNLYISLTDERYGLYNHQDSNWRQLRENGLKIPDRSSIPVLQPDNQNRATTALRYAQNLERLSKECRHIIGFFGIGLDSHIAGILPDSPAVTESGIVCDFDGGQFERITIAPSFFERITDGIIYTEGAVKAEAFEKLSKDLPVETYPDQLIKRCQSYKLIYNREGV